MVNIVTTEWFPLNFLSQVVKVDAACLKNASISRAHVRK